MQESDEVDHGGVQWFGELDRDLSVVTMQRRA